MTETKMKYSEYKEKYSEYKTVYGSYNKAEKTIIVKLPDDVKYTPAESETHTESGKWHEVIVNANNIKCRSNTSVCVMLPNKSKYKNFEMWITNKLFKPYGEMYKILFKSDFSFKIRKRGKGKSNKFAVIEEKEISADELLEIYKGRVIDQEYPELHTPEAIEPVETIVPEELKDED